MYKALITDLDGTAVHLASKDGADVTKRTKEAISQSQSKGHKITCATGRPWEFAKPVIDALSLKSACIIEGGTRIIDPATGTTLWEKALDTGAAEAALDIVKRESDEAQVAFEGKQRRSIMDTLPISEMNGLPPGMRILYFLRVSEEPALKIVNAINAQGFAVAHVTPSWQGDFLDIHVSHREGTKEHALAAWHKLEGVTKAETIAMGDSSNDIPLFQSAGLKIAVANATPELQQLADYIAPAQQDEALRHVIEKFLLN